MEHRKYHWLYFVLGIMIAIILGTLMGCGQAQTSGGVDCYQCPPPPPQCCAAMIPECQACKEGCSVEEWMKKTCGEADVMGWDEENGWMCGLVIID